MNCKIIAMYLPQFHQIPENDEFWGAGFTDWVTVRNAKPMYKGHHQPRKPLNDNYYDLSLKDNVKWQCDLAKEAGVYGLGIYHYWFNNEKNLLTKPAEIIRDNDDIDMNYCLAWDNGNWKRSWSNVSGNAWSPLADDNNAKNGPAILIPYILGGKEDWNNHYNYLRNHFCKEKYIKLNNRPVFIIFNYSDEIAEMSDYWDKLAQRDGYNGVHIIYRNKNKGKIVSKSIVPSGRFVFNYEPSHNGWFHTTFYQRLCRRIRIMLGLRRNEENGVLFYDYDHIWRKIILNAQSSNKKKYIYHGAYVTYDDSPRRGVHGGRIVKGASPEKFSFYLKQLIDLSNIQNKPFLFLTAWNEWGEGAYLEPDSENKYAYINALKKVCRQNEQ